VYNVLALLAAQDIVAHVPGIHEATVYVLSQIGHPLDEPLVATALVHTTDDRLTASTQAAVAEVLDHHLANVAEVGVRIRHRELTLF